VSSEVSIVAIEIGGTKLQIFRADGTGTIRDRKKLPVDPVGGASAIRTAIENYFRSSSTHTDIVAVGFGGPVERDTGKIFESFQIKGWSGFELREWLRSTCGCDVVVENDANAAAIGEAVRGAGTGHRNVFYVTLGSGVGSGFVTNGQLYVAAPAEMEFGHLRLNREGEFLEQHCAGWAVNKKILEAIADAGNDSILAQLVKTDPGHEARHLAAALMQNDKLALIILHEFAETLGFALSHVVHLLSPDVIVLGGGLSSIGQPLADAVQTALRRHLMKVFLPGPQIAIAKLGEDAVPVGAIEIARQQLIVT
jgi:glucokinase